MYVFAVEPVDDGDVGGKEPPPSPHATIVAHNNTNTPTRVNAVSRLARRIVISTKIPEYRNGCGRSYLNGGGWRVRQSPTRSTERLYPD